MCVEHRLPGKQECDSEITDQLAIGSPSSLDGGGFCRYQRLLFRSTMRKPASNLPSSLLFEAFFDAITGHQPA